MNRSFLIAAIATFSASLSFADFGALQDKDYTMIQGGATCELINADGDTVAIADSSEVVVRVHDEALALRPIKDTFFFYSKDLPRVTTYAVNDSKMDVEMIKVTEKKDGTIEMEMNEPFIPAKVVNLSKNCGA